MIVSASRYELFKLSDLPDQTRPVGCDGYIYSHDEVLLVTNLDGDGMALCFRKEFTNLKGE